MSKPALLIKINSNDSARASSAAAQSTRSIPQLQEIHSQGLRDFVHSETTKLSITPKTFKSRVFVWENSSVVPDQESLQPQDLGFWYEDTYEFAGNRVSRYGINGANITGEYLLRGGLSLPALPDSQAEVKSETSGKSGKGGRPIEHHPIEVKVLMKALEHLQDEGARTVLVDVIARDPQNGTMVKILPDGHPEIHTVLLYKNPPALDSGKSDVAVIDPSNFSYSSHLSSDSLRLQLKPLRFNMAQDLLGKIVTLSTSDQIYNAPKDRTGYADHLFRDCIDIAVKLAFGLNIAASSDPALCIKPENITTLDVIRQISNLTKIDPAFQGSGLPVRMKQTSDFQQVQALCALESAIHNLLKSYGNLSNQSLRIEKLEEYQEILGSKGSIGLLLQDLLRYHAESTEVLSQALALENTVVSKLAIETATEAALDYAANGLVGVTLDTALHALIAES